MTELPQLSELSRQSTSSHVTSGPKLISQTHRIPWNTADELILSKSMVGKDQPDGGWQGLADQLASVMSTPRTSESLRYRYNSVIRKRQKTRDRRKSTCQKILLKLENQLTVVE